MLGRHVWLRPSPVKALQWSRDVVLARWERLARGDGLSLKAARLEMGVPCTARPCPSWGDAEGPPGQPGSCPSSL